MEQPRHSARSTMAHLILSPSQKTRSRLTWMRSRVTYHQDPCRGHESPGSSARDYAQFRSRSEGFAKRPLARKVIAIGISTGGPNSLQYVLSQLPADFPAAIVVVQHMPEGFTELFARRLDECCAVDVKEAQTGDLLLAGRVLISPGNQHIKVRRMPRAQRCDLE